MTYINDCLVIEKQNKTLDTFWSLLYCITHIHIYLHSCASTLYMYVYSVLWYSVTRSTLYVKGTCRV